MGGAAALFMAIVIIVIGLFKNNPTEPAPNALWLGQNWAYASHDDDSVRDLVNRLRDHDIGAVYVHVSELNVDGTWTGRVDEQNLFSEVQNEVIAFADQFHRLGSDIDLYGTVVFRTDLDSDGNRLDSARMRRAVVDFSVHVVTTLGFDGVFLQVDPFVPNGDENFLDLLHQIRQAIGEEALFAVALFPDWTPVDAAIPMPSIIAPGVAWDTRYKQRIALLQLDQMVIRAYDSAMSADDNFTADDYADWVAFQTQSYAEALTAVQTDSRLLIAVSTSDNIAFVHDVRVENIPSATVGVRRGLQRAGEAAPVVQGIAIYADWTTDAVEWTQFEDNWLDFQ